MDTLILLFHILSTAIMCGVVWFVQMIHYPLFAFVEGDNFAKFEKEHIRLTKFLIMPAMLVEIATAIILIFDTPLSLNYSYINLFVLGLIWISTFFIQVPLHSKLSSAKNESIIKRLIATNWIRTILWTGRLVLLLSVLIFQL